MNRRLSIAVVVALALMSCGGEGRTKSANVETAEVVNVSDDIVDLSERERLLYESTAAKVAEAEAALSAVEAGEEQNTAKVFSDIRKLQYHYNDASMNTATREHCKALAERIIALKEHAKMLSANVGGNGSKANAIPELSSAKAQLISSCERYPLYLEAGDMLFYTIESDENIAVNIYNADKQTRMKHYATTNVNDSLRIDYSAIYLIEVVPHGNTYVRSNIGFRNADNTSAHRPKVVTEQVACKKGDFGATAVESIKLVNIFDDARMFTLRGQIKATFSGTARSIVAIPVPSGATNILYSMRISTSEQAQSSDGEFYENLGHSYRRIDVLKLPVYESRRRSGLIDMILDDNRPIRDEDAYCNLYVLRDQSEAKRFQDSSVAMSNLNYDVIYSALGTQSCNGSIPTNGSKTIYLGFENERMRYANYLWVEAVGVVPTTEYYATKYSIQR